MRKTDCKHCGHAKESHRWAVTRAKRKGSVYRGCRICKNAVKNGWREHECPGYEPVG
jgi:hypothetical protein